MSQKYFPIYTAIKAGHDPDEHLWNDLIAHCRCEVNRRISHYHFSLLANEAAVDRIIYDFIGELAKAVQNFDPNRTTFKTYVNGILDKMVIKSAKDINKRRREKNLEIEEYCMKQDETNDPEKITLIKEDIEELNQIMDQLTRTQYEVVKLRLKVELSTEETAEQLGIPPKIVSNRLNKALERIRTLHKRNHKTLKR
jgi:RNA polymerase sigma factor (sigma-70 family)